MYSSPDSLDTHTNTSLPLPLYTIGLIQGLSAATLRYANGPPDISVIYTYM